MDGLLAVDGGGGGWMVVDDGWWWMVDNNVAKQLTFATRIGF